MSCIKWVVRYCRSMPTKDKLSVFAQRVYEVTRSIPRGKVASYGDIARALGIRSAQAVGQALKRNPFAPDVPCHRVVAGNGSLGGFFGAIEGGKISEKEALLRSEGVAIELGRIDMTRFRHRL